MLEVVIEAAVRQGREQGSIGFGVEHPLHVDMIEGLAADIRHFHGGDQLLLDGLAGISGCGADHLLDVHV